MGTSVEGADDEWAERLRVCRQHGLIETSFNYWKRELQARDVAAVALPTIAWPTLALCTNTSVDALGFRNSCCYPNAWEISYWCGCRFNGPFEVAIITHACHL